MAASPSVDADRPSGPRSRKGAKTRARLVEAAKTVFETDGFLEARITDIAEGAGLSHGSFYHYFDSKEQVFREVADAMDDRLNAPLPDVILDHASQATPRDRIREANREFLTSYQKEARLFIEVEQVARHDEPLRTARLEHQRQHGEDLARSLRELQRRRLVDRKLDPVLTAHALGAMVTRFAELWFVRGTVECTLEEAVDQLTRLVGNALQLPNAPRKRPSQ